MRTVKQVKLGQETVKRIAKELKKLGTVKIEAGAHGKPDIEFNPNPKYIDDLIMTCGIECKRCKGIAYKKSVSSVYITKSQWYGLKEWCSKMHMVPLVIVEIVVKRGKNLYFVLDWGDIENRINKSKGKTITLSMWQIMHLGRKLGSWLW